MDGLLRNVRVFKFQRGPEDQYRTITEDYKHKGVTRFQFTTVRNPRKFSTMAGTGMATNRNVISGEEVLIWLQAQGLIGTGELGYGLSMNPSMNMQDPMTEWGPDQQAIQQQMGTQQGITNQGMAIRQA